MKLFERYPPAEVHTPVDSKASKQTFAVQPVNSLVRRRNAPCDPVGGPAACLEPAPRGTTCPACEPLAALAICADSLQHRSTKLLPWKLQLKCCHTSTSRLNSSDAAHGLDNVVMGPMAPGCK